MVFPVLNTGTATHSPHAFFSVIIDWANKNDTAMLLLLNCRIGIKELVVQGTDKLGAIL